MWPKKRGKKTKAKKKADTPSQKLLKVQIFIGVAIVVVISLLVTAVYHLTRIDSLQVTEVKVVGGKTISHAEVEQLTRESFAGDYFRLVPKSFRYTFSESAVEEGLRSLDRINNLQVELNNQTVVVVFDEYLPVALWCADLASEECLFLDNQGYAFAPAPLLQGGAFVRYIENGVKPEKHQIAFTNEFVKNNQAFIEQLKDEMGIYVTHVEKMADYDVEYTVSGGGQIKTSQTIDLDKSFKNLRTVLQSEDFIHLGSGEFQYIDLRFGDKVFVNEEVGVAEDVASTTAEFE